MVNIYLNLAFRRSLIYWQGKSGLLSLLGMRALIYKSTGSWYIAKNAEGKTFQARIKGIFKIDNISSTNPIAVGDEVEMEIEEVDVQSV